MKFLKKFQVLYLVFFTAGIFSCATAPVYWDKQKDVIRTINVMAVADNSYREEYLNWEERIKKNLNAVSKNFEEQFGIRFNIVGIKEWKLENSNGIVIREGGGVNNKGLIIVLKNEFKITSEIDVVVGFTYLASDAGGEAEPLGNYILLYKDIIIEEWALAHEFGHIFDAMDYAEIDGKNLPISVMNYTWLKIIPYFDKENAERIMKNKFRNFHERAE
ncbi:MAG: M12 family metallo-peptidase [Patescibacteria group bacterium]